MIHRLVAATSLMLLAVGAQAADSAGTAADAPPANVDTGPVPLVRRPLWELGLGISGLRLPDYRGSDQSHSYVLPFPYVVYRGTWFKSDRNGTRALLFNSDRVKFDLSFGAAAPTRGNTAARAGMPTLPGNAEVGPSLNITLAEAASRRWKLDLRLPVRAAISLQRSPRYVGATASPNLNLDIDGVGREDWNLGFLTGPLYANRRYHAQYYEVDPAYATPTRPAYRAEGGYAGWQNLIAASRRWGSARIAGFARHEHLRGAVYEDSPLVRSRSAVMVGASVSWVFMSSSDTVLAAPD